MSEVQMSEASFHEWLVNKEDEYNGNKGWAVSGGEILPCRVVWRIAGSEDCGFYGYHSEITAISECGRQFEFELNIGYSECGWVWESLTDDKFFDWNDYESAVEYAKSGR